MCSVSANQCPPLYGSYAQHVDLDSAKVSSVYCNIRGRKHVTCQRCVAESKQKGEKSSSCEGHDEECP